MSRLRYIGFTLLLGLLCAAPAQADPVSDWNAKAVAAASMPVPIGRSGPHALLDLAVVHTAMHDAVQAIEGNYKPYNYAGTGSGCWRRRPRWQRRTGRWLLYPDQRTTLDTDYNNYVNLNGLSGDPGLAVGIAAAGAVHAAHYRPIIAVDPYGGIDEIGQWRSPVALRFHYLAFSSPFTLKRVDQFRPPPPPPLGSVRYARDYDEVKRMGAAEAHLPPNENTELAWFWSVDFVAQFNETARQLATGQLLSVGDSARLFALLNLAAADAAMAVWDSKVFYNFWRPISAIIDGDYDGNQRTDGDGGWTSLLAAPPYPDYVSGANGLTGAFTGILRLFFDTDAMEFTVKTTSGNVPLDRERSLHQLLASRAGSCRCPGPSRHPFPFRGRRGAASGRARRALDVPEIPATGAGQQTLKLASIGPGLRAARPGPLRRSYEIIPRRTA